MGNNGGNNNLEYGGQTDEFGNQYPSDMDKIISSNISEADINPRFGRGHSVTDDERLDDDDEMNDLGHTVLAALQEFGYRPGDEINAEELHSVMKLIPEGVDIEDDSVGLRGVSPEEYGAIRDYFEDSVRSQNLYQSFVQNGILQMADVPRLAVNPDKVNADFDINGVRSSNDHIQRTVERATEDVRQMELNNMIDEMRAGF